ncbi:hypothetical protein [Candidatus Albibeggiatoa sp. nov. BB20]|uniref:hypothetical protein n=1 Tax=Candidatus Albibeggiatoa sp. nov. BB20 TaxID=3162723 RepID=UPI0033657B99
MLNHKQLELGEQLFTDLHKYFSEIKLIDISESLINSKNIWVNIKISSDNDRWIELHETASDLSMDILLDYGYHITINPIEERLAA